jgi:hypothetical protein
MEDYWVEFKIVNGFVNLIEKCLHLFFGKIEIVMYHFLQISSFWLVAIDILIDHIPDVIYCMYIMNSLVLSMVLDATFGLADCAGTGTCKATS